MKELKDKRLLALGDKLQAIDYMFVNKAKEWDKKTYLARAPEWTKQKREIIVEIVNNCEASDELDILEKAAWEIYKKRDLRKLNEKIGIRTVEV